MLLADELYFLAHEDSTGKARLHARALGIGLAAALLGELVLFERITIAQDLVSVMDRRPPDDALAHTTLDQLAGEQQQHTVRTWLTFLAQTAAADVAQRLARAGHVQVVQTRRLFGTTKTHVPVNPSAAAWPENRLRHTFTQGKPISIPDATLAGLAGAAGLIDRFLWDADSNARRYYSYAVQSLPVPLRDLTAHTEAAVGDAVLSHRP